jgi:archaetidylinositol phosphate synthase
MGIAAGALYGLNSVFAGAAYAGAVMLLLSGLFDFIDGGVARINKKASKFGAAIDWIVDKYVDCIVLLGIGLGCMVDMRIVAIAIIGSMINTFIKPVVYAEIGYQQKHDGKIKDPLEGVGIYGRPETIITIIVFSCLSAFTFFGYNAMTIGVAIVAIGTNLSAFQRVLYLYWNRNKY